MKAFKDIKEDISEHRDEAKYEAKKDYRCVRSRGAWLVALKDGEVLTEADSQTFKNAKELKEGIEYWKSEGATEFYIDGGFDGADNVQDLNEFYVPYVSEWSFKLEL